MSFPLYIYYEILIRLSDFLPHIGEYLSFQEFEGHYTIKTTTGELMVSEEILTKQFKDPALLTSIDLAHLAGDYKSRSQISYR